MFDAIVLGGGAAGIFAAIQIATYLPQVKVVVVEKTAQLLSKVKISGGGRCNVTHACFDPKTLCQNYPRGKKELLGPFHHFQPKETIQWFLDHGVELKTEKDGRMFPTSDSSQTIVDALLAACKTGGVEIQTQTKIEKIEKKDSHFVLHTKGEKPLLASTLLLATGSHFSGHSFAKTLGHTIQMPIPSLFTFNVPSSPLKELSGISVDPVKVHLLGSRFAQEGPLLITHFGFSGPAVLKLSAFAAKELHAKNYQSKIGINWLPKLGLEEIKNRLFACKEREGGKMLATTNPFGFPKQLWRTFLPLAAKEHPLRHVSKKNLVVLGEKLHNDHYQIEGKTTNKEEFVTCGGVALKEVNFTTLESKKCPSLFFAGEILDIDAITGGFNFQNAWTTGYLAAKGIVSVINKNDS